MSSRDPLTGAVLYRIKYDALTVVARMNAGREDVDMEQVKKQLMFVQAQLVAAAVRDPAMQEYGREKLMEFQEASLREIVEDRRGIKRRAPEA
jgi:hypothetical protein